MKFKLSSLLLLFTFLAFAIGLGFQVHLLRRQVAELKAELKAINTKPRFVVFPQTAPATRSSPFRLLNSGVIVNPSVEEGMKADEQEHRHRMEQRLNKKEDRAPKVPSLESRAR
jgi:hypothetical protein